MLIRIVCASSILFVFWNSCEGILQVPSVLGYGGQTTTVVCTDTGITTGNAYSWLKDSSVIYSKNNEGTVKDGKYSGTTQAGQLSLQVLNTDISDAGQYQCNHQFRDAFGTLSVAYKPENITYTVSKGNVLQLTFAAVKVYPNDSNINSVFCNSQVSPITETFNASQNIIPNNDDTFLFDINWVGTTANVSLTGDYVCTVNFTLIEPYVTTLNVSFTEITITTLTTTTHSSTTNPIDTTEAKITTTTLTTTTHSSSTIPIDTTDSTVKPTEPECEKGWFICWWWILPLIIVSIGIITICSVLIVRHHNKKKQGQAVAEHEGEETLNNESKQDKVLSLDTPKTRNLALKPLDYSKRTEHKTQNDTDNESNVSTKHVIPSMEYKKSEDNVQSRKGTSKTQTRGISANFDDNSKHATFVSGPISPKENDTNVSTSTFNIPTTPHNTAGRVLPSPPTATEHHENENQTTERKKKKKKKKKKSEQDTSEHDTLKNKE